MTAGGASGASRPSLRGRPKFSTRTAAEDDSRLAPDEFLDASAADSLRPSNGQSSQTPSPYEPLTSRSQPEPREHNQTGRWFGKLFPSRDGKQRHGRQDISDTQPFHGSSVAIDVDKRDTNTHRHHPVHMDNSNKLGTFSGVFVPTTLNVLSILMFLRFGFILGQSGVIGMLGMLIASYMINLVTTMSISAIATNGTVRGGGAYYLISRSLGPEFGGSIGIVFYLGFVFNTGMNAVGLIDCFVENFGTVSGTWANFLQEGFWWQYLWGTIVMVLCTAICLAGSSIFSRASNGLLVILLVSTLSIPVSALVMKPFYAPQLGVEFTGFRMRTFLENLKPRLTKGAAGSQLRGRENFQDLFGILFPATGGIFAGASMSGDLKNPSKSIPKGTLSGLALTFVTYTLVIVSMAASITRQSFYNNVNIIQVTNISSGIVLLGEFATSFFSSLMGVIGSAKLLQAIARDRLLPGLSIFGQGSKKTDEPTYAIFLTLIVTQLSMLLDINKIASFITMTYLMTFLGTNLACFLLKISSAPNFRPSFHYFNWYTAAAGTLLSGICMFFVDGLYATGCVGILVILFLMIHYTSPPKSWGDVSQSLIYHQVRKYLLRLKQEHVKFWRPQILLFVNDYDTQYKMIHFCNALKKGALFVLGHVIVTDDFENSVLEARRQQSAWTKFIEYSKVKAFINISVSPSAEWGVRNIVLNSGLGGMRPNIVVIDQYRKEKSPVEIVTSPTALRRQSSASHRTGDHSQQIKQANPISEQSYMTILEDLLFKLRINVAVAKGFEELELPNATGQNTKKYIDLWPIQMSAELAADRESKQNVLTTNFDTYTLILQLGCILNTVPSWKKSYKLRVAVFVEYETDVDEERGRVETLLEKLRIEAEVLVFWLASGDVKTYQVIVNGDTSPRMAETVDKVDSALKDEAWWRGLQNLRKGSQDLRSQSKLNKISKLLGQMPNTSFLEGRHKPTQRFEGIRRLIESSKRRRSISSFGGLGVSMGMQTHRLLDSFVDAHAESSSETSDSEESDFEPYVSDPGEESEAEGSVSPGSKKPAGPPTPGTLRRSKSADVTLGSGEAGGSSKNQAGQRTPPMITATNTNEQQTPTRNPIPRTASSNRFTSAPIPETKVNPDEGPGPSIMFASGSPPRPGRDFTPHVHESIYAHPSPSPTPTPASAGPASGFPSQASMALSFNDLPCRAQHLILNELMAMHSHETAVIFSTLPSPIEGTRRDEAACQSYLSDMEILWQGLPPCLLVHSNSMTVTMNL
ncbi:hypothetical protein DTO217A2_268 [Paecilomyces variotii]|nr:hypothetical protein DTO217A2_268 [Paecilomyces variotii]KAJ9409565.1 hypothetical protein DTO045G8_2491 [Paecilomyces variotii]